jgi:exodeoxyribonuclease VII small subunit
MQSGPDQAHQTEALESLSYEEAFQRLEQILIALETAELSLEETLQRFEQGQALAHRCAALLDQAELRIQQIAASQIIPFTAAE